MNQPSLTKFEPMIRPNGQLFINTSLIKNLPTRTDLEVVTIDANGIAAGLGADRVANIVMLGAIVERTGIVKPESIIKAMEKLMKGSKENLLPLNKKALTSWKRI
jgi:2-oxoglutarate ferredoxin oxidoreductase subunit gamma